MFGQNIRAFMQHTYPQHPERLEMDFGDGRAGHANPPTTSSPLFLKPSHHGTSYQLRWSMLQHSTRSRVVYPKLPRPPVHRHGIPMGVCRLHPRTRTPTPAKCHYNLKRQIAFLSQNEAATLQYLQQRPTLNSLFNSAS